MNNEIEKVAQQLGVQLLFRQQYTLATGRADAVYNRFVIEYEPPGSLRPNLSHKRTQPHPWEKINEKYQVGMKVMGTVTRLMPFGAFVRLDSSIEGLVHISELAHRRIVHPKEVVTEEQELTLMVISINSEKRQMRLSLRQAQEEEEAGIPAKRKNVKPF